MQTNLIGKCTGTLPEKDKGSKVILIGELIADTLRECGEAYIGVITPVSIKFGIEKESFFITFLQISL